MSDASPASQNGRAHFLTRLLFGAVLFFFLSSFVSVELPRVSAVLDTFLDCLESFEQGSAVASSDPSSSDAQAKLLNPRALGAAVEWVAAMVQGQ
jgi:hypothetical protein